ncbi:unnamed protein product [Lupinus luteus]|uniref:Agamous-like MADS-box protein AGL80 n=1 Tax=Lupinus luteus TaxID=3873 RepID=A0AAV1VW37_LUPLU
MKKTREISNLYGTHACVILYGPNQPQPEIWSSQPGVHDVINKFLAMPMIERSCNMFSRQSFLEKMLTKTSKKLENLKKENKKKEMDIFLFKCVNTGSIVNNADNVDMNCLLWEINQNLNDIEGKRGKDETQHDTTIAPNGAEALSREGTTVGGDVKGMIGTVENQDWAFDSSNNGGDAMVPFGDDNLSNEFEHGSSTP